MIQPSLPHSNRSSQAHFILVLDSNNRFLMRRSLSNWVHFRRWWPVPCGGDTLTSFKCSWTSSSWSWSLDCMTRSNTCRSSLPWVSKRRVESSGAKVRHPHSRCHQLPPWSDQLHGQRWPAATRQNSRQLRCCGSALGTWRPLYWSGARSTLRLRPARKNEPHLLAPYQRQLGVVQNEAQQLDSGFGGHKYGGPNDDFPLCTGIIETEQQDTTS